MTPARFAQGLTFDEYVTYVATPENRARESSPTTGSNPRRDWSEFLHARYAAARLTEAQTASIRWLAAQPGGPARILVISEEWSSDCRRDVPYLQRLAEAGGMELRIFVRDGQRYLDAPRPDPADTPNADLVLAYLNRRDDGEFASIPVAVFLDRAWNELYRYVEYPAIYRKDALVAKLRAPRPGETAAQTTERWRRDFFAVLDSPFYDVWAHAGIAEIISALHERQMLA
jgi:hypothetical protein